MFRFNKLLIVGVLCLGVLACNNESKTRNSAAAGKQVKNENSLTGIKKAGSFKTEALKRFQGTWFCYKYLKNDTVQEPANKYAYERYNENFAKEFTRYAYFTISDDTLKGMDIFNTPIRIYKRSLDDWDLSTEEETLLKIIEPASDSLIFVAPVKPYEYYYNKYFPNFPSYPRAPLNAVKVLSNNNFIIYYRECYFFFKKDSTRVKSDCYGVPGDENNFFKVNIRYNTTDIREVCAKFRQDYPFGANMILTYSANVAKILNHNWNDDNYLRLEDDAFATGKFILKITQHKGYTDLLYYFDYFFDKDMEGYDEYQG